MVAERAEIIGRVQQENRLTEKKNKKLMKRNNRITRVKMLEHFLRHNKIYSTTPEGILEHLRRRANTKWVFLSFFLSIAGLPLMVSEKAVQVGLTLPVLAALGLFLVVIILRCETMTWSSWKEEKRIVKELEAARKAFQTCFNRDILKCDNLSLLQSEVADALFKKGAEVERYSTPCAAEERVRGELKRLWDSGNEFVPVPSYKEIFKVARQLQQIDNAKWTMG